MSFSNLSLSGSFTLSGSLSASGVTVGISGGGLVTAVISNPSGDSVTGTWHSSGTVTATAFAGGESFSASAPLNSGGTVSGTLGSFHFTDGIITGVGVFNIAGTNVDYTASFPIAGFGSITTTVHMTGAGGSTGPAPNPRLGTSGPDTFTGTTGDDVFDGGAGDDNLSGGAGNDKLFGGAGNDVVDGGEGDDKLNGGSGDDTLIGGSGNNLLEGGDGFDVAFLAGVRSDYRITLLDGPNTGKLFFTLNGLEPGDVVNLVSKDGRIDKLSGVEKVKFLGDNAEFQVNRNQLLQGVPVYVGGQYFADTTNSGVVNGGNGDDVLDGLEGNDTMTGGLGNDTYIVESSGDVVNELLGQGTADLVKTSLASYLLPANVERLEFTGSGNFVGTGNGQANILKGGAGNDTLDGGLGADRMEGGAGNDTYIVDLGANPETGTPGDVAFEGTLLADSGGIDTVNASVTFTLGVNVENLVLTGTANLNGTGNAASNTLTGNGGNNQLSGLGGDDTFFASGGNDTFTGGLGNDTLNLAARPFTFAEKSKPGGFTVERPDAATVVITDLDTSQKFFVKGAWGALSGDRGIESFVFSDQTVTLEQLIANTASAFNDPYTGTDGADQFDGGAGNDVINGGAGNDVLIGGAGDDTLDGGTGNDAMTGGLGNDTYVVDSLTDTVTEQLNQGTADLVKTALASYMLGENVEKLEYTGTGNFSGTGNGQANILKGGAGDDTLDGGLGADRMEGGAGNDTYFVNVLANADAGTPGDVVFEGTATADSGGIDTVNASVTYTLGVNVENLVLIGTANLNGTGNTKNNALMGNAGNNLLSGLGGDDTFFTSGGNDTFTGGLGNDTLNLSTLTFTFAEKSKPGGFTVERPDAATVVITDLDTSQKFFVKGAWGALSGDRGIENYVFSDQTVTLDLLIVNTASAFADTFTSTAGVDLFAGLAGNDTYIIDDANDVVTELLNQGTADLVKTALSTYTLSENVEKLEYTGTGNFSGTGNGQANILKGGAGNDTLDGGLGADRMEGGGGNDTYFVDLPADVVFEGTLLADSGGISDTVNSSATYTLTVNVEILVLTGTLNLSGTGNAQANTLIGNDGNNVLSGLGENDTLNGGLGNDRLTGGAGADQFDFTTALNAAGNMDTITDFQVGVDKIRLEADIFTGVAADALGFHAGAGLTQATAAGDRIIYNSTTGALFYDADGAGGASAVQFAILSTHPSLLSSDFSII